MQIYFSKILLIKMIVWCVFYQIVTNMAYDIQLLSSLG